MGTNLAGRGWLSRSASGFTCRILPCRSPSETTARWVGCIFVFLRMRRCEKAWRWGGRTQNNAIYEFSNADELLVAFSIPNPSAPAQYGKVLPIRHGFI